MSAPKNPESPEQEPLEPPVDVIGGEARGRNPLRSLLRNVRDALRGEAYDYTSGSLPRAVWLLAVPMVIELGMEAIFAICDIFFIARLGKEAVAAVGLTEALLTIVYALAIGLSMSATALVARRIGEKNVEGARRAATSAIAVGVLGGVMLGVPGFLYAEELLRLMKADEGVVEVGLGYTRIILGLNIVVMLIHLLNAVFRGAGDAGLAMRSLTLANLINLVLDPCLIFGLGPFPELGVTGAAVATTIGRGTGVCYQLGLLRFGDGKLALRGPGVTVRPKLVLEIIRLSGGGIGQLLIATTSWTVLMRLASKFGEEVVAGYTIAIRIVILAFLPAWGLSNAAATLVGQNLGAGKPDRAERSVIITGLYNMIFLGTVMILFLSLAPWLVGWFEVDAATQKVGVTALRILSYGYVFYAWGMVLTQAFNGAGDTMTPTHINFVCFWLCQIPLAYALANPLGFEESGVFWAVCLAEALLAPVSYVIFRRGKWKATKVAADA